jgi:thiol-disulfide isomerase/thioredoxin
MRFEVFGKQNCAKCESTKAKLAHLVSKFQAGAPVAFVDMSTVEGMAEGAFNDVHDIPTVILRSDGGGLVARWDGRAPHSNEILAYLGGAGGAGNLSASAAE